MVGWFTTTSRIDSSDTECVNITICCVSSDVSTDSDGGGGGTEKCDGIGVGPHCGNVA